MWGNADALASLGKQEREMSCDEIRYNMDDRWISKLQVARERERE